MDKKINKCFCGIFGDKDQTVILEHLLLTNETGFYYTAKDISEANKIEIRKCAHVLQGLKRLGIVKTGKPDKRAATYKLDKSNYYSRILLRTFKAILKGE